MDARNTPAPSLGMEILNAEVVALALEMMRSDITFLSFLVLAFRT